MESPTLIGSSVVLANALCIGQLIDVQFLTDVMYCSFEVSMPPAAIVTLLLVLIGAPVVFIRSIVPPELDRTKFVLLPLPTVY